MKKIDTVRFGTIDAEEDKIIHFKDGIPAFEEEKEFLLIPYDEESPYLFLQSIASPDLAFLVTLPHIFFEDYAFEIDDETEKELDLKGPDDVAIYTLITVPGKKIQDMTTNLAAPVILNVRNMRAKQLVLGDKHYTTKHRLFPEKKGEK